MGGVAAIGKLQLAQPALTLGWSAPLLGDHVSWLSLVAAAFVVAATAVGRNASVRPTRQLAASSDGQNLVKYAAGDQAGSADIGPTR